MKITEAVVRGVTSQPLLAAAGLVVAAYIVHSCLTYARLRHFPGPKLAGWTRIPLILWHFSGRVHLKFQEINETYGRSSSRQALNGSLETHRTKGPLAQVAPGVLLTSDPELIRRMAAPRSRYKRNTWYMAFRFNPNKDHVGCERDNEAHAQLKSKLTPGVSIYLALCFVTLSQDSFTHEKNKICSIPEGRLSIWRRRLMPTSWHL